MCISDPPGNAAGPWTWLENCPELSALGGDYPTRFCLSFLKANRTGNRLLLILVTHLLSSSCPSGGGDDREGSELPKNIHGLGARMALSSSDWTAPLSEIQGHWDQLARRPWDGESPPEATRNMGKPCRNNACSKRLLELCLPSTPGEELRAPPHHRLPPHTQFSGPARKESPTRGCGLVSEAGKQQWS